MNISHWQCEQNTKCDALLAEKGSNTLFIHSLTRMKKNCSDAYEKRKDVVAQTIHGFEYDIVEVTLIHAYIRDSKKCRRRGREKQLLSALRGLCVCVRYIRQNRV